MRVSPIGCAFDRLDGTSTDTDEVVTPIFADGFESGDTGVCS